MIKDFSKLESILNLEQGTISKAIESEEEVDLELPELVIKTKEEHETFLSNIDKQKKQQYDDGKEKGIKDAINQNIESFGIDLEGKAKTFENFAEAMKIKLEADLGSPKEEQINKLSQDLEKMKGNYKALEEEYTGFKSQVTTKEKEYAIDGTLDKLLPSEKTLLPKDKLKILLKAEYNIDVNENGGLLFKKGNDVIKNDKTLEPIEAESLISEFIKPYVAGQSQGGGSKDDLGLKQATVFDKFVTEMEARNISQNSLEFQQEMKSRQQAGTLTL